jgi:16S rRNA (uracil1498-N3)-methyltransferase
MHRFFVPPDSLDAGRVRIRGDVAQQIRRVLRMRPGDTFYLLDGLGYEYLATLSEFDKDEVWADVQEKAQVQTEPAHKVSMYLSLLNKPDKFEYALQKCTELGAVRFVPLVAERSVPGAPRSMRRERWERIIQEAAEQSGRGLIPTLDEPIPLKTALQIESNVLSEGTHVAIMPELGGEGTIAGSLQSHEGARTASIFIGPEGGFAPSEVSMAQDAGVAIVGLGARTLRAETAAIAALTLVLYELGEMGEASPGRSVM